VVKAAGEFALIVFGVLAALAFEGWRDDVRDRQAETEYVEDLREELAGNIRTVDLFLTSLGRSASRLENSINLLETGLYAESPADFVLGFFGGSAYVGQLQLDDVVFRDLTSSGRLQLIRDRTIRRSVIAHYNRLEANSARLEARLELYDSRLAPLVSRNLPVGLVDVRGGGRASSVLADAKPADVQAAAGALARAPSLAAEARAQLLTLREQVRMLRNIQRVLEEQAALLA
jgi:hypothetical protein